MVCSIFILLKIHVRCMPFEAYCTKGKNCSHQQCLQLIGLQNSRHCFQELTLSILVPQLLISNQFNFVLCSPYVNFDMLPVYIIM